jgi:hypothetical protein
VKFTWIREYDAALWGALDIANGKLYIPGPFRIHRWKLIVRNPTGGGGAGSGIMWIGQVNLATGGALSEIVRTPFTFGGVAPGPDQDMELDFGDEGLQVQSPLSFITPALSFSVLGLFTNTGAGATGQVISYFQYSLDYPYQYARPSFLP